MELTVEGTFQVRQAYKFLVFNRQKMLLYLEGKGLEQQQNRDLSEGASWYSATFEGFEL